MKIFIFTGPYINHWDEVSVANGMGGSETWAIEIADQLSKLGNEVVLFGDPEFSHQVNGYYLSRWNDEQLLYSGCDVLIVSRLSWVVGREIPCGKMLFMTHDTNPLYYENYPDLEYWAPVNKFLVLSDWHKHHCFSYHEFMNESNTEIVTNGFSKDLYNPKGVTKKLQTVWSSSLFRGFFDVYKLIYYPLILNHSDFKIHVCCGTLSDADKDALYRASLLPNVVVHERLSKVELAKLQTESLLWIYPGSFPETFCITAVENAAAGNALICPLSYGLGTTLKGYDLSLDILNESNAAQYLAIAENVINDDQYRNELVKVTYSLAQKYSWEKAATQLMNIINNL